MSRSAVEGGRAAMDVQHGAFIALCYKFEPDFDPLYCSYSQQCSSAEYLASSLALVLLFSSAKSLTSIGTMQSLSSLRSELHLLQVYILELLSYRSSPCEMRSQ